MAWQVIHTNKFKRSIRTLVNSVPDYYSINTINKLFSKIEEYTSLLSDNPCLGQVEPCLEDFPYVFRRIVVKPYFKIIYSITDDFVVFHDVWDTRMNPSILKNQLIWNL